MPNDMLDQPIQPEDMLQDIALNLYFVIAIKQDMALLQHEKEEQWVDGQILGRCLTKIS